MITEQPNVNVRIENSNSIGNTALHVPDYRGPQVTGPRGIAVDITEWQQLDSLIRELAAQVMQIRPAITRITFEFEA